MGHWKIVDVVERKFVYVNVPSCGTLTLQFHHYDKAIHAVIEEVGAATAKESTLPRRRFKGRAKRIPPRRSHCGNCCIGRFGVQRFAKGLLLP